MADRRPYENKAEKPSERKRRSATTANAMRVRVLISHDGLSAGEVMVKPIAIAEMMIKKGYWEEH